MKILIADDSVLRINSISRILEIHPEIEIAGTAKSGQEVLVKIEDLRPNLVLLGLQESIVITKVLSIKHPQIEVIILSSFDKDKFDRAIKAGAKGCLDRGVLEKDLIAAIDAVMRGSTVYLTQEHSPGNTEQFSFLKNWNNLLAAEIINFWLTNQQYTINLENFLQALGITVKSDKLFDEFSDKNEFEFAYIKALKQGNSSKVDLFEELKERSEYLFAQLPVSLDSLNYIEGEIRKWYTGKKFSEGYTTVSVIPKNQDQILTEELDKKLQDLIQSFWGKTSIKESLDCLKKLEIFLFNCREKYEEKKQEFILEERECLRIYNERVSAMSSHPNNLDKNYNIAKNALFYLYSAKLNTEIYSRANQALEKMIQRNQFYIEDLDKACLFLTQIRDNLLAKVNKNVHTLLPLIFEQFLNHLDLEALKKQIEQELGRSMCKLGVNRSISEKELQNILLKKLSPYTQKICSQIKQELNQEFSEQNTRLERLSTEIEAC